MVSFEEFKKLHDQLEERAKEALAKSDIMMYTEEDVENVMHLMGFMLAVQEAQKIMQNVDDKFKSS